MKAQNPILLVVNPIAGNRNKEDIVHSTHAAAAAKNYNLEIYKTTGKDDEKAVSSLIEKIDPSRILVAGGDGTISMVARCIYGKEIGLGIIAAGSANGMAVNLGLPPQLEKQVAIALSGKTMKIDTIFVNDRLCLHIADLGLNAALIKNYEESDIRGKLGYFLQSIPTVIGSNFPYNFTIETENKIVEETGVFLAIANANKFGMGTTINPEGKMNDGKFEIVVFKNLDFVEIIKTTQENPQMSKESVHTFSTDHARIRVKKPVPLQIDGEFLGKTQTVQVRMAPHRLLMAIPDPFYYAYHSKTIR